MATFGPARFGAKQQWEFLRYAVAPGVLVRGGAPYLFKRFLQEEQPQTVVSYVDFSHSTKQDSFLVSCGFKEAAPTGPALHWHNPVSGKHVAQTSLLKVGADRLLGTSYGPREVCGMGNDEIMVAEGFLPVYTAGNRVFLYTA